MIIYKTSEWKGYGNQNFYWNEYRLEGNQVVKYKCHRYKHFDGDESGWDYNESCEKAWSINDPEMPDWIHEYIYGGGRYEE